MASFDENGKYIKTNWKAGDKITATKLNKIEESIEAVNDNDISRHVEADARLDALEAKDVAHDKEFTNVKNLIADNKAAAELGVYEINSRMTFLENELNEGIEEVNNVASTVDGKIAVVDGKIAAADASMKAQVNQGKADMEAMVAEVEDNLEHKVNDYDLEFIDITKFGIEANSDNDITENVNALIKNGYLKLYFPEGSYKMNLVISKPDIKIKGAGINKTIISPYSDNDVFNLFVNTENLFRVEISNMSIVNSEFITGNGIKIHSGGKKSTHNDQHNFSNLYINGFKHNIDITDRCIYTTFRNIICENAMMNNLNIFATDCINHLQFDNCKFWNAKENGVSIIGETYDVCVMVINFTSCTIEGNNKNNNDEKGGIYIEKVSNITFDTPYIELNSKNGLIARDFVNGFDMTNALMWDSEYAYNIDCNQFNGKISTSRMTGKRKYKAISSESSLIEIANYVSGEVEEEPAGSNRTSFVSLTPLVLSTKWFSQDQVSVNDCNVLINSATHNLTTINNGRIGQILYIINAGNACTIKQSGNITLKNNSDLTLDGYNTLSLTLIFNGTKWIELSRVTRS